MNPFGRGGARRCKTSVAGRHRPVGRAGGPAVVAHQLVKEIASLRLYDSRRDTELSVADGERLTTAQIRTPLLGTANAMLASNKNKTVIATKTRAQPPTNLASQGFGHPHEDDCAR